MTKKYQYIEHKKIGSANNYYFCNTIANTGYKIMMRFQDWYAKTSVHLSLLCAVHCMAMPFLAVASLTLPSFFHQPWVEALAMSLSLLLSGLVLVPQFVRYRTLIPFTLWTLAVLFTILALFCHLHSLSSVGCILCAAAVLYSRFVPHKSVCNSCHA